MRLVALPFMFLIAGCSNRDPSGVSPGAGGSGTTASGGSLNATGGNANPAGGSASSTGGTSSSGASGGTNDSGGSGATGSGASGGDGGAGDAGASGTGGATCTEDPPLPSGALTRDPGNPVLRNGPENYDYDKTGPRVVLKLGDADYRLWYEAVNEGNTQTTVGLATSTDGVDWTKTGTVMSPSESWEGNEISPNSILREGDELRLYYHAGGNTEAHRNIGTATSSDGNSWTRVEAPILTVGSSGSFDDDEVAEPRVFKLGASYRMYYTGKKAGGKTSLGMAESSDGVTFVKSGSNPIMNESEWGGFWGGAFFFEGGRWLLWRGVEGSSLHFASSSDGLDWTNGGSNPVLSQNPDSGAPDNGLVGDSVSGFRDGDTIRIYYTGYNSNLFGTEGRFEGICMAWVDAPAPCN